jgi:hypothetical protein
MDGERPLTDVLEDFVNMEGDSLCLELIGTYGIGKTTALHRLRSEHLKILDCIGDKYLWIYFDGNVFNSRLTEHQDDLLTILSDLARTVLLRYLELHNLTYRDYIDDLASHENELYGYKLTYSDSDLYPVVMRKLRRPSVKRLCYDLRYLVRQSGLGKVLVVFDNIDILPEAIQLLAVSKTQEICRACGAKGIIAVRRSTAAKLRHSYSQVFAKLLRQEVFPLPVRTVVRKRIRQALEHEHRRLYDIEFDEGGSIHWKLKESPEFVGTLLRALSQPSVVRLLSGLGNDSTRDMLDLALQIYRSHFLDSRKIVRKLSPTEKATPSSWNGRIPYHIALKSLMFLNHQVYSPEDSPIGNIFGTDRSDSHLGPFLRFFILKYISKRPDGTLSRDSLIDGLCRLVKTEAEEVRYELEWLSNEAWVEDEAGELLRVTRRGRFIEHTLMYDIDYLTHISVDTDMPEKTEHQLYTPAENADTRSHNLGLLITYLINRESQMVSFLTKYENADSYIREFGNTPMTEEVRRRLMAQEQHINPGREHTDDTVRNLDKKLIALGGCEAMSSMLSLLRTCSHSDLA